MRQYQQVTHSGALESLIFAARRRAILRLAANGAGWTAVCGLAAFSFLLLAGSSVLSWYWPLLCAAAAGLYLAWRLRKRLPSPYAAAQELDTGFGLRDLLATAFHFRAHTNAFATALHVNASSAAQPLTAAAALPLRMPRSGWLALALCGVAGVLFGVRYGVLHTFDLRAPLVTVRFDTLTGAPIKKLPRKAGEKPPPDGPEPFGMTVDENERLARNEDPLRQQQQMETVDVSGGDQILQGPRQGEHPGEQSSESDSGEENESGDMKLPEGMQGVEADSAGKDGAKQQAKDGKRDQNSMIDKMRDAFANMLDKLKMKGDGAESKSAQGKSDKQGKEMAKSEKGMPSPGKSKEQGDSDAGDQQGDSQQMQGAKSAKSDAPTGSEQQERSGVGKEDGNKDTQLVEHAEALGKLSEIFGRRAQDLKGEIMVEVSSSKNQQARTAYRERGAAHADSGSAIGRDEVPLNLQPYVQGYYDQVRKSAPKAKR